MCQAASAHRQHVEAPSWYGMPNTPIEQPRCPRTCPDGRKKLKKPMPHAGAPLHDVIGPKSSPTNIPNSRWPKDHPPDLRRHIPPRGGNSKLRTDGLPTNVLEVLLCIEDGFTSWHAALLHFIESNAMSALSETVVTSLLNYLCFPPPRHPGRRSSPRSPSAVGLAVLGKRARFLLEPRFVRAILRHSCQAVASCLVLKPPEAQARVCLAHYLSAF